ncbi:MAG: magnesium transporter CorA family protein [Clostridia bacterium]|nr:magnesium transporter CorA family protein [Clostridia bacterium]
MVSIYKHINGQFSLLDDFENGSWINLVAPTNEELDLVSQKTGADIDLLRAALDEEERSRIELEEEINQTIIVVDIPRVEKEGIDGYVYTTLPLGIIFVGDYIITVCLVRSSLLEDFIKGKVRKFYTYKRTRFVLLLLYRNSTRFLRYLRLIDKASVRLNEEMQRSYRNKELFQMMALEKSLVYFTTSLKGNEAVLEKLVKVNYVKKYHDDEELLEDVIVENKQAIEMCSIYRDILSGMMDAYASIISNNLSIVMKFLAAVTIVISLPTLVTSAWGMNVNLPWEYNPYGFAIVMSIALAITIFAVIWLWRRKMF